VRLALAEDLGIAGDVTTDALIDADATGSWAIMARRNGVVAGLDAAGLAAWFIDPELAIEISAPDGARVRAGAAIATIEGRVRSMLMAERVMLNFIGRLSGIATLTRAFVDALEGTSAVVAATRKTTPGLRALEKRAVRLGGGGAHRYGLDDAILIKDNHIAASGSITEAVSRARAYAGHLTAIEVEVDTLAQFEEALALKPHAILLDNFAPKDMRAAVKAAGGTVILEASGGVTIDNARAIAETGVNVLSVGALTHSVDALDVGLDAA